MKACWLLLVLLFPITVAAQVITTFAGTGSSVYSGEGGPAILAGIPNPAGGEFDKYGNYYFADGQSHRINKVSPAGILTTVAGNGSGGFMGDGGPATLARLKGPGAVRLDTVGNIYIADVQNLRIRKITAATGIITTIAGTGTGTYDFDDVPATAASLWGIQDICLDRNGNLYIADGFNYRIRKVTPAGIISTFAGNGTPGYSGEGTVADTSKIGLIVGLCTDTTGNIYTASNTICRVMKISTTGIMTTVAGNGSTVYIGDALPATDAQIIPLKVFVDEEDNLFIADRVNNRAFKVSASTGILNTVAGNGASADGGDGGPATAASMYAPTGVALDACGNLYIPTVGGSTSGTGRRIRKVTFNPVTTPTITVTGVSTATVGATVTVNAAVSGAGSAYSIRWFKNSALFSTTSTPTTIYTKGAGTDTITARVVPAVTTCYDSAMSVSAHLVTEGAVGLQSAPMAAALSVYPNPATDVLMVSAGFGQVRSIIITTLPGQVLMSRDAGSSEERLRIAHLPAGMYLLHIALSDGSKVVSRFVKQ